MSEIPYIRIGTAYFKLVKRPSINGEFNECLVKWDVNTIIRDHGKKYLSEIECFDGSVCYPNHFNYSKKIYGFYNTYAPFNHKPEKGEALQTLSFFKHIFGKQFELGLDYFKLLYENPTQSLPILCLVSEERSTGKSTFLKYLKAVFGDNMSYLDNHSLGSNFNADWGNKLLLGSDETSVQNEELQEKLKYLSTSNKNTIEGKGKERIEVDFFGKFVMCSNKEDSFVKIDASEIRYWVLKIPKFEKEDVFYLSKLIKEIPHFLDFTINRPFATERKTRMWFTTKQIETLALKKLMNNNRNRVEKELLSLIISAMDRHELDELHFVPLDLVNALNRARIKSDQTRIRQLLKKDWKLVNQKNSLSYRKFVVLSDGEIALIESKGRYFSINRKFISENFDESMTD